MRHYFNIYAENTDPDTGEKETQDIATISGDQPDLAEMLFNTLLKDTKDDPNVEIKMMECDSHPDTDELLSKVFIFGEQTMHLTSYIPNDMDLGNAVRKLKKELELN